MSKIEIAIVDYQMGNLRSVQKALEHAGASATVTSDPDEIARANKVILPGVGAFGDAIRELRARNLVEPIVESIHAGKPFLGICMGMQVLLEQSEENDGTSCLGLYEGSVKSFRRHVDPQEKIKVPHMGWNAIQQKQEHPLWSGIPQDSYFYFVHSYFVQPTDSEYAIGRTDYGLEFASVIASDNVFAMQCHPEKSASNGLRLLANFIQWRGA